MMTATKKKKKRNKKIQHLSKLLMTSKLPTYMLQLEATIPYLNFMRNKEVKTKLRYDQQLIECAMFGRSSCLVNLISHLIP